MTDVVEEKNEEEKKEEQVSDETTRDKVADKEPESLDAAKAEIDRLRAINKEVIESRDKAKGKLRTLEQAAEASEKAALEEQGKFKELYEAEKAKNESLEETYLNRERDIAISSALNAEGALDAEAASALLDRSSLETSEDGKVVESTVADAVAKLKEKHPVLFGEKKVPTGPSVKRAGEENTKGGYAEELRALQNKPGTTFRDIEALRKKYGRK